VNPMLRLPALLAAPMLLSAQISIDHVTVAGRDLKTMQASLEAVGIPSQYGGPHANRATEMALTSFPDGSYLELIAPQANADAASLARHAWAKQMQGDAGPTAWAVRVKDFALELARLRATGVSVGEPERGERTRPDGQRLQWEAARVGAGPNGTFFPFLIHDITPRKLRAFSTGKPATREFTGVTRVVIAVRHLDEAVKRFHQAFDVPPPIKQVAPEFGAQLALLGNLPVILAAPLGTDSWLRARLDQFGEGPCAFILGTRSPEHQQAAAKTRWFGIDIGWFDSAKLGWRLGFEPEV
jgi:hypothetical protein